MGIITTFNEINNSSFYGKKIKIEGDRAFQKTILQYINEIESVSIGKKLLSELSDQEIIVIKACSETQTSPGEIQFNLNAIESRIVGVNPQGEKQFYKTKGAIVLAHELIHAYHFQKQTNLWEYLPENKEFNTLEEQSTISGYVSGIYDSLNENQFEKEFNLSCQRSSWVFSSFLDDGEDPLEMSINGISRLHDAAGCGATKDLKKFLNKMKGNEINVEDEMGLTPLHFAVFNRYLSIVKELLSKGASISVCDKRGYSAFLTAIKVGDKDIIKEFLKAGADVNEVNPYNKFSALHIAAKLGNHHLIKFLVEKCKADPHVINNRGKTPLHIAKKAGHLKAANYLSQILSKN